MLTCEIGYGSWRGVAAIGRPPFVVVSQACLWLSNQFAAGGIGRIAKCRAAIQALIQTLQRELAPIMRFAARLPFT